MSQSDQPFCKPLTHAWFGENVNPTGKICIYKEGWRAYFWNMVFDAWWYYFAKNGTALPCENGNDFSRFEKDVSLIGWVRNPIFWKMKYVAKITPAQIIICCQHGIIEALHTFFVRERPFCKWSLTKSKWLKKNAREAFFQVELSVVFGGWMKLNV